MQTLHIELDMPLPIASALGLSAANAGQEVRRLLALFLYEHGRISLGKACELGGFSQWEFAEMNRELNIPAHYTARDLQADLARLNDV
jgi:predicted HTH domain antitoxin